MKINLLYGDGKGDILNSHLNINPFISDLSFEEDYIIQGEITNLDAYVDDAEEEEIIAYDVIDYLEPFTVNSVIDHWIKKIRHNGTIIIGATDLHLLSKAISQYKVDYFKANELLHGNQKEHYMIKKVSMTALGLCNYLTEKHGLKIMKKILGNNVDDFHMTIEAKR